jgi:hypothetical protein
MIGDNLRKLCGILLVSAIAGAGLPLLVQAEAETETETPHRKAETEQAEYAYPVASRILIAELPVSLLPRREYTISASESGLIELYVPTFDKHYEAGTHLGGVNIERLEADEALLELEEARFAAKEIPKWHLAQKREYSSLKRQLEDLNTQYALLQEIVSAPESFDGILDDFFGEEDDHAAQVQESIARLEAQLAQMEAVIEYTDSEQPEKLELGAERLQLEMKRKRFDERYREAHLSVPFDGLVQFRFPYVEGELNYVTVGTKIATVRDLNEIYAAMPVLDPAWRTIPVEKIELSVRSSRGRRHGHFVKQLVEPKGGRQEILYLFDFDEKDYPVLSPLVGGEIDGSVYRLLDDACLIVPKFSLVSKSPEIFRAGGWEALIEAFMPGHRLVYVGMNSIAVSLEATGAAEPQSGEFSSTKPF